MANRAKMLVRHSGRQLTRSEVDDLAEHLKRRFGSPEFSTCDTAFGVARNALSICSTMGEVRTRGEADQIWYNDPHELDDVPDGAQIWDEHDGPPIVGAVGEQLISVHFLNVRYFEPVHWETGNWPITRDVAFFLRSSIAGAQVWFGGDGWGCAAFPLEGAKLAELDAHYLAMPLKSGRSDEGCRHCQGRPMYCRSGWESFRHEREGGLTLNWCDGCGGMTARLEPDGSIYESPEGVPYGYAAEAPFDKARRVFVA